MRSERREVQSRLADGWDANAGAWIEWTRRELDSYSVHKLSFLPLIPPPGRLTVDVGAVRVVSAASCKHWDIASLRSIGR